MNTAEYLKAVKMFFGNILMIGKFYTKKISVYIQW